jgi:hypothetical protein
MKPAVAPVLPVTFITIIEFHCNKSLARHVTLNGATASETRYCVQKPNAHAIRDTLHLHQYSPAFNIIVQESLVVAAVFSFTMLERYLCRK